MELRSEVLGDVTVMHFDFPSLDASTVREFKASAEPLIADSSKIVFDMEALSFMDSNGIGAVLSCLRTLNARGGDLKLCGLSRSIRSLFELVRMHRIFDIFDKPEEAVAAFSRN